MSWETQFLSEYMVLSILFILIKKFLSRLSILVSQYSNFFLIQLSRYKRPSVDFYFQDAKFKDITTALPFSTMLLILFGRLLSRVVNLEAVEQGCKPWVRVASINAFYPGSMCSMGSLWSSYLPYPYPYQEILANLGEESRENISCQVEWVIPAKKGFRWVGTESQTSVAYLSKMHPGIIGAYDPEALTLGTECQSLTREKRHNPEQAWEVMRFPSPSATTPTHSIL